MKKTWYSVISALMEYVVLIAPTAGYAIYCYEDTLKYSMSQSSKGVFWSLISVSILAAILFKIFKKRYERYVAGYVQQKTDLETRPEDELLIKKVAEKADIIDNLDYIVAAIPVMILLTVLAAFQSAIEQLMIILEIMIVSLVAKSGLHCGTVAMKKHAMLKKIEEKGNDK